jgi:acetyl esterase
MYFHGGGWVLGDKVTHDRLVRELAEAVHACVVFPDYINSPEARYPTQNEQAYASLVYAVEHAQELNVDASRLAIIGDSVGGNMSAVMTLLAKERGGPKIGSRCCSTRSWTTCRTAPPTRSSARGRGSPPRPCAGCST